jgi:hypothetical protein
VGDQTWTLTTYIDADGPGVRISGDPEPDRIGLDLPIPRKLSPITFANPLHSDDWAVLGLVTSDAARVIIEFDTGRTIEAQLFVLPAAVSNTAKAFAAEGAGSVTAHVIKALDESGRTLASEYRPAVDADPSA